MLKLTKQPLTLILNESVRHPGNTFNRTVKRTRFEFHLICPQAAHPSLQGNSILQNFLEASEEDWALEMSRAAAFGGGGPASSFMSGSGGPKSKLDRTLQLFRDLGHSTASLVHGKHDEEDEDPEYLKVMISAKLGFKLQ